MNLESRIEAFSRLGSRMKEVIIPHLNGISRSNPWFTPSAILKASDSLSTLLTSGNLLRWVQPYLPLEPKTPADILVISAGNIPMVGFHDFLCVLISGSTYIGKLSSKDNQLIPHIADELIRINPQFSQRIRFTERSVSAGAVIATGGSNTGRYLSREFMGIPSIIRTNRTSAAILDGTENSQELDGLASDILEFFGLGCRSISHVFFPEGASTARLADALNRYPDSTPNPMYRDNLIFQKACLKLANIPYSETKNVLVTENSSLFSPIAVLHYSFYSHSRNLTTFLDTQEGNIQCIVGHGHTPFGRAQKPELWDYADHIDTLQFLKTSGH